MDGFKAMIVPMHASPNLTRPNAQKQPTTYMRRYSPDTYQTDADWDTRLKLECSTAIKACCDQYVISNG